jgi:hypothetical protein
MMAIPVLMNPVMVPALVFQQMMTAIPAMTATPALPRTAVSPEPVWEPLLQMAQPVMTATPAQAAKLVFPEDALTARTANV